MKEILCTLGPSSLNEESIRGLTRLGVSLFRINLSHTKLKDLPRVIRLIQAHTKVPVCLDSEGAQVRTGDYKAVSLKVKEGTKIRLSSKASKAGPRSLYFYPVDIVRRLVPGDVISIDFHSVKVKVLSKDKNDVWAHVLSGGQIGRNKAVTIERRLALPALTAKDRAAIKIGKRFGIRHFALSFANSAADVREARRAFGGKFTLISKIECQNGVRNLDGILSGSDAVLIDRGDLSREEPIERIPWLQKYIIRRANKARKKVYVATNLLESMTTAHGPTRAEVNDVINTLLDGADGLVLAAETAIGHDPVGCARMMKKLIGQFEGGFDLDGPYQPSSITHDRLAPVFWFTGLSGAGKSTVAQKAKRRLEKKGFSVLITDGDDMRAGRREKLGFTEKDIKMNNRLIAEYCAERRGKHDVILVPIISPYQESRWAARQALSPGFYEVYCSAGLSCVAERDTKGLYRKARNGEIDNLIGFSPRNPYEAPKRPDLELPTHRQTAERSAAELTDFILRSVHAGLS